MRRSALGALASVAVITLLSACGASASTLAAPSGPRLGAFGTTHYRHVILVVMENRSYGAAMSTPGFLKLARRYVSANHAYAVSHPSLPNYLALTGGSTFGISSDCTTCYVSAPNLGAELSAANVSWDDFSQDLPYRCYLGAWSGSYAGKHNPFRYYDDIRSSFAMCSHLLPLAPLYGDLKKGASYLPHFFFVTPNLCNDGHSCSGATAATWLTSFLGHVTSSSAWRSSTLVIVTWDESADSDTAAITPSGKVSFGSGGGHVLTLFCAANLAHGAVVTTPLNEEGILAMVEQNFSVPLIAGAGAWAGHTPAL